MEITNILQKAFDRYFQTLRKRGYVENDVNKILLVLSCINTIFDSELLYFVTENDYHEICKAINNLANIDCCLVDIPQKFGDELYRKVKTNILYRITEDNILRTTEESLKRTL